MKNCNSRSIRGRAVRQLALCCVTLGSLSLLSSSLHAQKLAAPGGWQLYNWATDNFNDTSLGWQWKDTHGWYNWEQSTRKNGQKTWTRFRTQNIQMTGSHMRIINWHHSTPITEWNPKVNQNSTFDYSGGVLASKANWLTEAQYQCHSRVEWNHADVWPTFWIDKSGADELDIMQYQGNILDQSHVEKTRPSSASNFLSQRSWTPWMANKWEHDWAMARVRSWSHWAARTTRSTYPTFYINGKLEHTSYISRVDSSMEMLFTSSPHFRHLPEPGNYPSFRVDWVETHIP
ncbi:hypothetical protein [Coraliomargarita akajimensis]|uniref:GH16 domain-containing protein n=1 Tax=Coraliomargarita akajimensis (strain DSM 45221 / IAM 15411 / JCM 23193 / KCTC 12865 / 04OKA010-24) TaxID=583355 RepID=D5EL61_CORAD|nr:hypothetical protein [Coraliomargarita akajimensis]ADE53163.1 hypothetical protein Caka_0134 [Coraliomargarita akajimensis DSM 45221]